jgi:hypothetical protein
MAYGYYGKIIPGWFDIKSEKTLFFFNILIKS